MRQGGRKEEKGLMQRGEKRKRERVRGRDGGGWDSKMEGGRRRRKDVRTV